jgi:MoaA/NifB/PqqE/SkfB family radical SAM enzyme
MKVFITTKCSLRCGHCLNSIKSIPKSVASVDFVKKQIDFIRNCGVRNVELGVLIGDTLEYPVNEFKQIISYLESLNDIDVVSISSSFLFLTKEHIDIINNTNKLKLQLSWYGKNDDEYKSVAGFKKGFSRLIKNVELLRNIKSKVLVTVISMFPEKTKDNILIDLLNDIEKKTKIKVVYDDDATITNWSNMMTDKITFVEKNRRGACDYLFADTGIDEHGNVLGCAWFDYGRLVKLGNINENTPEQILEKHEELVRQQEFGIFQGPCKNCTVYNCSGKKMDGTDG